MATNASTPSASFARDLGLFDATMIGVGAMIGAGIFVLTGIAAGEAGPLTGIPIAHKDIFCTQDVRTSCGSRMLEHFVSPYDATVVANLRH